MLTNREERPNARVPGRVAGYRPKGHVLIVSPLISMFDRVCSEPILSTRNEFQLDVNLSDEAQARRRHCTVTFGSRPRVSE